IVSTDIVGQPTSYPICRFCNKEKPPEVTEEERRLYGHLDKIASELKLDWWDGDFPISECLDRMKQIKG
ncbi:MAG: hypothetical protein KAR20_30010, partial [Candidatus Heimdallarchaeota archaeon]|nr:hypothetical protein [Candidatus Heimdallarchaeota archaeon]